ncbi:MAG: TIGR00341 family protein [Desulfurococcales archaeon]|nr:TIGR00341 family protein [Desulfurococcales archaeon]
MWRVTIHYRREEEDKIKRLLKEKQYNITYGDGTVIAYVPEGEVEDFLTQVENTLDMRYKENIVTADKPKIILGGPVKRTMNMKPSTMETPVDELIMKARQLSRIDPGKTLLAALASMITLIGLWLDSPAIVIGAMLLSPLLGPLYSLSLNLAFGKPRDTWKSLLNIIILTGAAYLTILAISLAIKQQGITIPASNEIISRTILTPLYAVLSILLGYAAILSTRKEVTEAIAGIAIAAALLPPLTVSALLLPVNIHGSMNALNITIQNITGITAGSLIAIITLNIKPRRTPYINTYTITLALVTAAIILYTLITQ